MQHKTILRNLHKMRRIFFSSVQIFVCNKRDTMLLYICTPFLFSSARTHLFDCDTAFTVRIGILSADFSIQIFCNILNQNLIVQHNTIL